MRNTVNNKYVFKYGQLNLKSLKKNIFENISENENQELYINF